MAAASVEELNELSAFLRLDSRKDLKASALEYVVGLTGTEEGRSLLLKSEDTLLPLLLQLTTDPQATASRDALLALLNLSGADQAARKLSAEPDLMPRLLQLLTDPAYQQADAICMLLANLSRTELGAGALVAAIASGSCPGLDQLVDVFNRAGYNPGAHFHHLASVFSNVSQVQQMRWMFTDPDCSLLPRLLPHLHHRDSPVRRAGMAGLLRNLAFEVDAHPWLLGEEVDILPVLLLPLAGPDQFSEEENDRLPLDLQYLPDNKEREPNGDIRRMLLEALMKLCSTQFGRVFLRDKGVYLIARELHQSEEDAEVARACEALISILIADEPEPSMQDLNKLDIPALIAKKFDQPSN